MRLAAPLALLVLVLARPAPAAGLCDHIPTFADGLTPAREIHVATTGSNTTGDGSPDRPYATIAFAAARATPGTALRVRPGTYAGGMFIADLLGTPQAPIWIGGVPGQPRPLIQGGTNAIHFSRCRGLVLHDLEIAGATGNGINCDDGGDLANPDAARFLIFQRLLIRDIGGTGNQDGLKLSGVRDFWVLDCEIARCGGAASGSLIDMVGCHRGLVARCSLHDASANALQCKGGTTAVELRWSRLIDCGERAVNIGGSTGFQFFRPPLSTTQPNAEARDIHVVANLIQGANAAVAFVGATGCTVASNTIITPHNWLFRILQETTSADGYAFDPCGNNRFENNLVYFDRSDLSTHVNIGPNTAPQTFVFSHNLWYAYDAPASSRPSLPSAEVGGLAGLDPRLATPRPAPAGDYSIGPDSPAAGAGAPPPAAGRTPGDITGRCYRAAPSIGAFEATCRPDFNLDGNADQDDVAYLRGIIAGGPNPTGRDPDFNRDGNADQDDVAALVRVIAGGPCP
jgi:hypothetical protein